MNIPFGMLTLCLSQLMAQMTATADGFKHYASHWNDNVKSLQKDVQSVEKKKEVAETSQATLESKKSLFTEALKEANAARDEAIAWATSIEFEQAKLINSVMVEAKGWLSQALSKLWLKKLRSRKHLLKNGLPKPQLIRLS